MTTSSKPGPAGGAPSGRTTMRPPIGGRRAKASRRRSAGSSSASASRGLEQRRARRRLQVLAARAVAEHAELDPSLPRRALVDALRGDRQQPVEHVLEVVGADGEDDVPHRA